VAIPHKKGGWPHRLNQIALSEAEGYFTITIFLTDEKEPACNL
jgi:hypothetical protein